MRKRILSILLCLVMVVGLFPTMAFAADGSGATTGSGTQRDPYCVSTYAEMKRLLQTQASYYIKVVGMDNDATNDGVPVHRLIAGRDFESTEPAIDIPSGANHHLEIATDIWFIADSQDGDKNIFSRLIDVESGSSLEITGTGSLRVEVNALTVKNAIIDNWGGKLTIDGSVTLNGIQDFRSNVATRPIWIDGGVTNIKGGYIYGHNNMKATSDDVTSAISFGNNLANGTELNISGGTIKQVNNATNQKNENSCALYVDNDKAANAIHLTGGIFEGGMKMKTGKPLSDLLTAGYQFYDMDANTAFDGSVSKTQKKLTVTPTGVNPTVIDKVSLNIKSLNERKTLSDLACGYSPNNKMVLDNFAVFKGLNNQRDKIEDQNTPYDANQEYTVMYVFYSNADFSFSNNIEDNVTVTGGDFWKADSFGGLTNTLRVFVNFPAASAAGQVVKTVTIQVKPQAERTKLEDFDCQSYTPTDSMGNPAHFLREGLNTDGSGSTPAAYDKNKDYSVVYQFPINSGCTIAEDISTADVTINDGKVWQVKSDSDGKNLLVYVNFPATGSTHTHSYGTEWKYDDTNHWHECECGDKADIAAHSASEWIIDTAATENADGAKHKECTVCKKVLETATIPATGSGEHTHSYGSEWKNDADNHWHECSCGAKAEEAAHTASEWITDTAATATTDGTKYKECTVCHRVLETGKIPATGSGEHTHSYSSDWKSDSINHWKECSCSDKADIAAHSASEWIVDTAATKTADGTKHKECTVCKKVLETATIPATGGGSSSGGGGVTTYAITVKSAKNGDVTASHKSASKGTTVTLTVDPDKGYVLDTLTVLDGKDKELKLTEKNGKYTFTMPASKVTVAATFKASAPTGKNPFIDVPAGSYYEDAVVWAVEKGITSGTSAVTFDPNGNCTRAQAVTFLWRAAGSPAPKTKVMPFTDVPSGSYYYDAVLWAMEQGITKGTSDTAFSPNASCTRAQIVTFLWRANGSPAVSGNSAFTDVASDAYYAAAVAWAEKNGVTGGIGNGLFGSGNNCTRAQIVTFLYRAMK